MSATFKREHNTSAMNCTCGHNYRDDNHNDNPSKAEECHEHQSSSSDQQNEQEIDRHTISLPLDTSFVQIPKMATMTANNSTQHKISRENGNTGSLSFKTNEKNSTVEKSSGSINLQYTQCVKRLYQTMSSTTESVPSLCQNCIQSIKETLMADTERLLAESLMYEQAILDDTAQRKGWKQMIYRATTFDNDRHNRPTQDEAEGPGGPILNAESNIEDIYLREIQLLEQACREQRDELTQLRHIQKEHILAYDELQHFSESLAAEENALKLEAGAFDNDQEQLSRMLEEVQNEIDRLTSSEISLPALLVQLHIDVERGLRYPLINELRLAYRPKGDVQQMEIQSAWALAGFLLLVVATIFQFQSQNWKIVPLSHCVKLIFCPAASADKNKMKKEENQVVVFNLGHPETNGRKALLAWNALLCQVSKHVVRITSEAIQDGILDALEMPQLPFEISPSSIGGIVLTQLNENDDSGWSRVIHCMASNLQWLSNCASTYVLRQVVLLAPLRDVETNVLG